MRNLRSGIGALRLLGYRFEYVDNPTHDDVVLLGSFTWAQHYDRVMISDVAVAVAIRVSSTAEAHECSLTWASQGDAAAVVWALVELAPPSGP